MDTYGIVIHSLKLKVWIYLATIPSKLQSSFVLGQGVRLDAPYIHLFICWRCRMAALMLCYHSIAPCTCKSDISGAICHRFGFVFSFNIWVGLNRLSLAVLVSYPMALHSALLHRGYSSRIGGCWLYPRCSNA